MLKRVLMTASLALVMTVVGSLTGMAQSHPVEGAYDVTAKSSELGELKFQVILKLDNGKWKGEIKDAAMPLAVTAVTVDAANKVTITSDAGGTSVVIAGSYADGKITGQWTAGDMKGDWAGTQKVAAAAATTTGATASTGVAGLDGNWDATISVEGQTEFKFGLVIKKSGDKLVPEVTGGGDLSIVEVETRDPDVVNMTATYQGQGPIPLMGKRINADEAGGKWEAGGYSGSWKVTRKK
jgi:hypothetical protein